MESAAGAPPVERQNSREAWRSARAADYNRNKRKQHEARNRQKEKQHADWDGAPDGKKKVDIGAGPQRPRPRPRRVNLAKTKQIHKGVDVQTDEQRHEVWYESEDEDEDEEFQSEDEDEDEEFQSEDEDDVMKIKRWQQKERSEKLQKLRKKERQERERSEKLQQLRTAKVAKSLQVVEFASRFSAPEENVRAAALVIRHTNVEQRPKSIDALTKWIQRCGLHRLRVGPLVAPGMLAGALGDLLSDKPTLQATLKAFAREMPVLDHLESSHCHAYLPELAAFANRRLRGLASTDRSTPLKWTWVSLANWLCSQCYKDLSLDATALFHELQERGLVAIDGDRLTYNEEALVSTPAALSKLSRLALTDAPSALKAPHMIDIALNNFDLKVLASRLRTRGFKVYADLWLTAAQAIQGVTAPLCSSCKATIERLSSNHVLRITTQTLKLQGCDTDHFHVLLKAFANETVAQLQPGSFQLKGVASPPCFWHRLSAFQKIVPSLSLHAIPAEGKSKSASVVDITVILHTDHADDEADARTILQWLTMAPVVFRQFVPAASNFARRHIESLHDAAKKRHTVLDGRVELEWLLDGNPYSYLDMLTCMEVAHDHYISADSVDSWLDVHAFPTEAVLVEAMAARTSTQKGLHGASHFFAQFLDDMPDMLESLPWMKEIRNDVQYVLQ